MLCANYGPARKVFIAFCGKTKKHTDQPQYIDPLGPAGFDAKGRPIFEPTGGIAQRKQIFGDLDAFRPQIKADSEAAASGWRTAARDPGWATSQDLARRTIAGDYLKGSPELDAAMAGIRGRALAGAADQDARIRSGMARAGMGFSTANQQASQANRARTEADVAANEAQARLANYQAERGYQTQAPGMLAETLQTPLNYLSQAGSSLMSPLGQMSEIVKALTGGGSTATANTALVKEDGAGQHIAQAIGSL